MQVVVGERAEVEGEVKNKIKFECELDQDVNLEELLEIEVKQSVSEVKCEDGEASDEAIRCFPRQQENLCQT